MSEQNNGVSNATERTAEHSIFGKLDQYSDDRERLRWEGTFREYMDKLVEQPSVARSSHASMYEAFTKNPGYFTEGKNALYGAEKELGELKDFLRAGNEGLQMGKRILLLVGGPGSGKSTAVSGLKRLLENYSKTDEGALYGIKGCELHEEPLHLIPEELRPELEAELDIHIEGDLCEHCKIHYGKIESLAQIGEVPVERVLLSERDNVGISTFKPSDPKSQDISQLIGQVDLSKLGEYGTTSDAGAFRFNGAIDTANRGMIELVEVLKNDEKFLYTFLDLAQDRVVKAENFPHMSVDEVLVGHSNIAEYKRYMSEDRNEAIRDRTLVVWWKYPLRVSDEVKVYEKLIGEGELVRRKQVHVNPKALEVVADLSVLSRLRTPSNLSITKLQKLRLYNGEEVDGLSRRDLKSLQQEDREEGLTGISPRYVIDALSSELVEEGKKCLTPAGALRALEANVDRHPHTREMGEKEKAAFQQDLAAAKDLYKEIAISEIQRAFIGAREGEVEAIADKYLEHVSAFCGKVKLEDEFSEDGVDPDETFMRGIEEKVGISESGKKEFRSEIAARIMSTVLKKEAFDLKSLPKLREAIEDQLFATMKDAVRMVTSAKVPNEKQRKRMNDVHEALIENYGYCDECAGELIRYASQLLNGNN